MKINFTSAALMFLAFLASGTVRSQEPSDHPLVGRFEDSKIIDFKQTDFEEYVLLNRKVTGRVDWGDAEKKKYGKTLEGRITRITYESPRQRSTLEVFRAYEQALTGEDFKMLFQCDDAACGGRNFNHSVVPYDLSFSENYEDQRYLAAMKSRPGKGDVYVSVYTIKAYSVGGERKNRVYTQVDVIEEQARETKVVIIKAGEMANRISAEGKVALYGIYFDSGSASLKSDSRPSLDEIAKLLQNRPDLKLLVVGHTDNQGGFDYNIDLSRRRATAVTKALVKDYNIGLNRLKPWGVGYTAPVATNATEDGRAQNRRVELVKE